MNLTATIKQKTLRLIGLVLIAIPLIAFYTILRLLDWSARIAAIATVCLSGVVYLMLIIYVEPFVRQMLRPTRSKAQSQFLADGLEKGIDRYAEKGPLYTGVPELDFDRSNRYALRVHSGNWIHS